MVPILKLDKDDEEKEIDFELDWFLSMDVNKRYEMLLSKKNKY
ncbi:MAG: hypothetical protein PF545_05580 [Elusimicrobia bacterium]|jgi:hypothetical protein|nr:hypothetical protein [Elusimicrobiota bacterium]